jgi:hypothetical protein
MKAAQTDLNRQMQAGQGLGQVAQEQYGIGTGGLKTLSELGQLQQTQGQRTLDYPMLQAQNYAKLFGTPTIPAGETTQTTQPTTALTPSPLSQITGLLSSIGSVINRPNQVFNQPTQTQGQTQQSNMIQQVFDAFGFPQATRNVLAPLIQQYLPYKKGGSVKPVPKNFTKYLEHKAKRRM